MIYTVGAFHTSRYLSKQPKTFVTTSSQELMEQVKRLAWKRPCSHFLSQVSMESLGFAKSNNIVGIRVYEDINDPQIPQYRAAKNILQLLEN